MKDLESAGLISVELDAPIGCHEITITDKGKRVAEAGMRGMREMVDNG